MAPSQLCLGKTGPFQSTQHLGIGTFTGPSAGGSVQSEGNSFAAEFIDGVQATERALAERRFFCSGTRSVPCELVGPRQTLPYVCGQVKPRGLSLPHSPLSSFSLQAGRSGKPCRPTEEKRMGEAWMPLLRWSWEGRECDGLWEYGKHCQPQMSSPRASRDLVLGAPSMTVLCKRGGDTAWGAEGPQFCGLLLPSQLLPVSAVVTGCLI